jgi:hypothetical protein
MLSLPASSDGSEADALREVTKHDGIPTDCTIELRT